MTDALKPFIDKATAPLSQQDAESAFQIIFDGGANDMQIAGFLMALRTRGESVTEYTAATKIMRDKSLKITAPTGAIDIVGTGGDGKSTLNISTATAIVVAGAGVPVAKHGNRNLSSQSGTADALAACGVNIMSEPDRVQACIARHGIGFMMAPVHHPSMKYVMPARLALGTRTVFNILGPLTNPAGVRLHLCGAFSAELLRPMAEVLSALGSETAWLVHGGDGTDELSIAAPSAVVRLANGAITEGEISPEDAGLPVHPFAAIVGGSPAFNGAALRGLLDGALGAYRDAVLLNASAALVVAGVVSGLVEGVEVARESIDSGAARQKLTELANFTVHGG